MENKKGLSIALCCFLLLLAFAWFVGPRALDQLAKFAPELTVEGVYSTPEDANHAVFSWGERDSELAQLMEILNSTTYRRSLLDLIPLDRGRSVEGGSLLLVFPGSSNHITISVSNGQVQVQTGGGSKTRTYLPLDRQLQPRLFSFLEICVGARYCQMEQTFDQIFQGYGPSAPAKEARSFTVARQGSYPGFSDVPITFEQAQSYRETLAALRGQNYLPLSSFLGAADGGTAIYYADGCSPSCLAYWSGNILWLYDTQAGQWRGYLPLPPHSLGQKIDTICNL